MSRRSKGRSEGVDSVHDTTGSAQDQADFQIPTPARIPGPSATIEVWKDVDNGCSVAQTPIASWTRVKSEHMIVWGGEQDLRYPLAIHKLCRIAGL